MLLRAGRAVHAGATPDDAHRRAALPAFLLGRGIDQAYVYRSFDGVAVVAVAMNGLVCRRKNKKHSLSPSLTWRAQ
jgi:hypothetical protein